MPSRGRGGRSPSKRKPPLPPEARPRSTGPTVARTATSPIPPAPNIVETIAAADGDISPSGNTIDTAPSPIPPAPNISTITTAGGNNGPSVDLVDDADTIVDGFTRVDDADTIVDRGLVDDADTIVDGLTRANDRPPPPSTTTPSPPSTTTAIPHAPFNIDQLESIIQRAVNKSVAEAVDKAFTSSLTDTSSKGYRLVNKVFDDLLDHRQRREESSKHEYRRYEADPEAYIKHLDDDSTNASVNPPTVTRPPTPTVAFSPTTTVTPRTATNTGLQQLMDNQRPGNSANWAATHARVQTINTGPHNHHTDINAPNSPRCSIDDE